MRRLLLLTLLLASLAATGAGATVTYQSSSTAAGQASAFSFSHTVEADSNFLIVEIATDKAHTVSSITFAGNSMTQIANINNGDKSGISMWYLTDPPTGSGTISVTLAAGDKYSAAASTFSGVSTSSPTSGLQTATGSSLNPSTTVTSTADDLVIDFEASDGSTATPGSGQTQRWSRQRRDQSGTASGSYEAGGSSVTMSWTLDQSRPWSIIGVSLQHDDPPTQSYVAPTPADGSIRSQSYAYINTTVSDGSGINTCTLTVDGANQSMTKTGPATGGICYRNVTGLADGQHTVQAYATDTAGQTTSPGPRTFTVDTTDPTVTLNSPSDGAQNRDPDQILSYSVTDNIDTSLSCDLYVDGVYQKSQTTASGDTDTFGVTGLSETTHSWRVDCTDDAANTGQSPTRSFEVDVSPELGSLSATTDPIQGGAEQVITPDSISDPNNDALQFRCAYTASAVTSGTTICKETTTSYAPPYGAAQCSFDTQEIDGQETIYCAAYDTEYYSTTSTSSFTIDSTPPGLTTDSVAGDQSSPYIDSTDDGYTNITVSGESGMHCRFSTTDTGYSGMSSVNQCDVSGSTATCPADPAQGFPDLYVSCQDSLGNENNATNNLDVTDLLVDYTPPTTDTDAGPGIHVPGYTVNLTEADNVDADPDTTYCIDQSDTCSPSTGIDDGQSITFTTSDRGTNYLRISSTDDAGNTNLTSTTVDINELPSFTAAQDNATTIRGGAAVRVSTTASDPDGQDLSLYVCRTSGATAAGCTGQSWCSNTTAATDPSCSFTAPRDDTTHDWYAYVYDTKDEAATDNPRSGSFTTDSTAPTITIDDPQNQTYTQDSVPAAITTDEPTNRSYYQLDGGSNVTMGEISSTSFASTLSSLSDGQHQVSFWAEDEYGNWRQSPTVSFEIVTDTTPPSLSPVFPTNNSLIGLSTFFANITADEALVSATASLDGGANQTMTNASDPASRDWYRQFTGVSDGSHSLRFWGTDEANNIGSLFIRFDVDDTPPAYSNVDAQPDPAAEGLEDVVCSTYWTDANGLTNGIVSENSSGSFTNHTIPVSGTGDWTNYTIGSGSLDADGYACRFYTTDTPGNQNKVQTQFQVTDQTPPDPTLVDPTNTTYTVRDIPVSVTVDESSSAATYSLDGGTNVSLGQDTATSFSGTATGVSDGLHSIRAWVQDDGGNWNSTGTRYFTVDATPPTAGVVDARPNPAAADVDDVTCYAYWSDASGLQTGIVSENSTGSFVNHTVTVSGTTDWTNHTIPSSELSAVDYGCRFYAQDTPGNWNKDQARFSVTDQTPPTLTIVSPNNASISQDSVTAEFTTDETTTTGIYSLDGGANTSMDDITSTRWRATVSNLSYGQHSITYWAQDTAGNWGMSGTRYFFINTSAPDTTPPTISPINPANDSVIGTTTTYLNVSTDETVTNVNRSLDGGTNTSMSNTSRQDWYSQVTGLSEGLHTVRYWAQDTAGNRGSGLHRFTVDLTAPAYSNVDAQPDPAAEGLEDVVCSAYWTDTNGLQTATVAENSTGTFQNHTVLISGTTDWTNYTIGSGSLDAGGYACRFYTTDTAGNQNSTTTQFQVTDQTPPTATLLDPDNATYTTDDIPVNISGDEALGSGSYSLDGTPNVSLSINGRFGSGTATGVADGLHSLVGWITDTAGNQDMTGTRYFRVDTTAPTATQVDAQPDPAAEGTDDVTCSAYWTDTNGLQTGIVAENSTGSFVNHTVTVSGTTDWTNHTIPQSDLDAGGYACRFYAQDTPGNWNTAQTQFQVTDQTRPTPTLVFPENQTYTSQDIPVSVTVDEPSDTAYYSLDGGTNVSMTQNSQTTFSATAAGVANGLHSITAWVNDTAGNWNQTETRYFTVDTTAGDTTPPTLTAIRPLDGASYRSGFTARVNASEDLTEANITINGGQNLSMTPDTARSFTYTITAGDLQQGSNTVRFSATDTSSNRNLGRSQEIAFTFDSQAPQYVTAQTGVRPTGPTTEDTVRCQSYWTDAIGLDSVTIGENSSGSFTNHTVPVSGTIDWANQSLGHLDPDGYACRFWAEDTVGNRNATTTAFTVSDATPPALANLSYEPNTTAGLDPGVPVAVNVSVTDQSSIDAVRLEYHNGSGPFTSIPMTVQQGSIYGANFTPTAGNWTFRVTANDTIGNAVNGTATTITVATDRSFTVDDGLPDTEAVTKQDGIVTLGNVSIDNTGDTRLTVNSTTNQSWIGLSNTSLDLASGDGHNLTVRLNATAAPVGIFTYGINITGSNASFTRTEQLSHRAVVQQAAGPLLELDLVQFSSAVTRGQSDITYQVRATNIGSQSASGTWLAWDLPSAFSLQSGTLNRSVGTLLPGGSSTNTITVRVPSSASDQRVNLTAEAVSGNVSDRLSQSITIGDPTVVTEPSDGGGGGGGGGGGAPSGETAQNVLSGRLVLNSTRRVHVLRGNSTSFPVTVANIFEGTLLQDLSVTVDGLPPGATTVEGVPDDRLEYGDNTTATVRITGPRYLQTGTRELTVVLSGRLLDDGFRPGRRINRTFVDRRFITLVIHGVSQEEATAAIENATTTLDQIDTDTGSGRLEQLVQQARQQLEARDYDQAHALAQQVGRLVQAARQSRQILDQLDADIATATADTASRYGLGPDYATARELMQLAEVAAARGDYQTALERAEQARDAFREEQAGVYPAAIAVNNWQELVLGTIAVIVVGLILAYLTRRRRLIRSIHRLDEREDALLEDLVDLQVRYYKQEELSDQQYEQRQERIREQLSDIQKERIKLRKAIPVRYGTKRTLERLSEEREDVLERLRQLQESYYEDETIGKQRYEAESSVLTDRLGEIEQETARIEIQRHLRDIK